MPPQVLQSGMRIVALWIVVSSVLLNINSPLRADGLLRRLPPDGTAVKYDLVQSGTYRICEMGLESCESISVDGTGHVRIATVGTATVAGLTCRWIEIEKDIRVGDRQVFSLTKLLVPEVDLADGSRPLARAFRVLRTTDPERAPQLMMGEKQRQEALAQLQELIPNAPGDSNRVNSKFTNQEIELESGKLQCTCHVFDSVEDRYATHGPHRVQAYRVFRVFVDDSSPTGVVSMVMHSESQTISAPHMEGLKTDTDRLQHASGSVITRLTLREVAADATSKFPDQK